MVASVDKEQAVKDKPASEEWSSEINAIARGVEVQLSLLTGFSNTVTQQTINIAQRLGIPEKEIQRWVAERRMHNYPGSTAIKSPRKVISTRTKWYDDVGNHMD